MEGLQLSWQLILYQWVNFFILMAILTFLFNKFIRPFMHKRSSDIKTAFEEIEKQKKEAESLRQSLTGQLAEMRQRAKEEIDKAEEEGNRIREELLTRSEKEAVTILEKTKKEIEAEKQKAIMELRKEVGSLAMLATRQLIKKQMDEQTARRLVDDFLVEMSHNPPKTTE
jgi:F-type H+-transporting ATPase subunit b